VKIFDSRNITGPLKFLLRILFGIRFGDDKQTAMEKLWESQGPKRTLFGMSGNLLKSVVLALVGIGVQFALFLIKRRKAHRLEEIKR